MEKILSKLKSAFRSKQFIFICLVLLLTVTFYTDFLGHDSYFDNFQDNAESLALGRIVAARDGLDVDSKYGLGWLYSTEYSGETKNIKFYEFGYQKDYLNYGDFVDSVSKSEPIIAFPISPYTESIIVQGSSVILKGGQEREIVETKQDSKYIYAYVSGDIIDTESQGYIHDYKIKLSDGETLGSITYSDYESQVGLQGWIYYILTFIVPRYQLPLFRLAMCLILAVVLVFICFQIHKKYSLLLASCFYVTFWLSPVIVNTSYNLYWVLFTWFIPMLLGLLAVNYPQKRKIIYILFFFALLIRSLCGYEYISAIMMGGILFPVVEWISQRDRQKKREAFFSVLWIGVCSLAGFIAALVLHAFIRGGGNLFAGMELIYKNDILRRTLGGNPADFDDVYRKSLEASIFDSIGRTINFRAEILFGIPAKLSKLLFILPALIFGFEFFESGKVNAQKATLYIFAALTALSWYVLGKSHTYIHAGFSYILWYFGFIEVCFYVILDFVITKVRGIQKSKS